MRKFLALALTALIAVPAPALAQTVRVTLEVPVTGAPGLSLPGPFALSASAPSAPSLVPLCASFPVLSSPAITAAPAASVPVALQPRAAMLITAIQPALSAPELPTEVQKADTGKGFDGSVATEEAALVAASPVASEPAPLTVSGNSQRVLASDLDRKIAALGRVPAPHPWLEKANVVLAYGGLTAAAVALHAPFEHIGPLVAAAVLSPLLSLGLFFYAASQSAVPRALFKGVKPSAETTAMIARLAVEARVSAPARVKILPGDEIEAQVGARDKAGYEIRFTAAFESLHPEAKESILRHELAHVRHHDIPWRKAHIFLAPLAPMIALVGVVGKTPLEVVLMAAITAAAALLVPASIQRSEYLADQYAASKPEGAGPLVRSLIENSENPARAASVLSGRVSSSETGWRRRAFMALDDLINTHPSHDRRIARLVRLADKEKSR